MESVKTEIEKKIEQVLFRVKLTKSLDRGLPLRPK